MSLDLTSRPRDVHDWRDPQALTKSLFPCLLLLSCLPLGLPALALLASTGDPGQNTRTSPGYYACAGPPLLANRSLGGKGGPALRCLSREAWVAIGALGAGQGVWHLVAPARCNPPSHYLDWPDSRIRFVRAEHRVCSRTGHVGMFCCPGLAVRREDSVLAAECTSPHSPSPGLECISCSPLLAASHPSKPLLAGLADELCTMFWLPSTLPDQFSAKMSEMLHLHPFYPGKYHNMIFPYFYFQNWPFSFTELTTS